MISHLVDWLQYGQFSRHPFDPLDLPELLAVQVDKGVLWIDFDDHQENLPVGRIRLESDAIEYWEITPAQYQGACFRLMFGSLGVLLGPVPLYTFWGVLPALVWLVLSGVSWWIVWLPLWLEARHRCRTPQVCHRLRIWYEGEPTDLHFTALEELETIKGNVLRGMQDIAFSIRIDVSGNGNAVNVGHGNTGHVHHRPDA